MAEEMCRPIKKKRGGAIGKLSIQTVLETQRYSIESSRAFEYDFRSNNSMTEVWNALKNNNVISIKHKGCGLFNNRHTMT